MKRNFVWLMLPLVLGASVWGVKWRADHPPVTQWDLRVRSLMSEASIRVVHNTHTRTKQRIKLLLSEKEKKAFIDSLHLSPQISSVSGVSVGRSGVFDILCHTNKPIKSRAMNVSIVISLDHRVGKVNVSEFGRSNVYDLHPATTKRWLELLLNSPASTPHFVNESTNGG